MSEKKIDLIAQLLKKAESTTPEEAEALTAAAERLMVKYAIDQAVIDARRIKEGKTHEKIVQLPIIFEGVYRNDLLDLGASVIYALGEIRALQSKRPDHTTLYVVGFESDAQQAEVLIRSLHMQAMVALKAWWYEARYTPRYEFMRDAAKKQARRQFIRSFGYGAAARIRESKRLILDEMSSGTDLVLVDRGQKVQDFVDGMTLRPNRDKGFKHYDHGAATAGNEAGRNANTGGRAMTQGRGLPAGARA